MKICNNRQDRFKEVFSVPWPQLSQLTGLEELTFDDLQLDLWTHEPTKLEALKKLCVGPPSCLLMLFTGRLLGVLLLKNLTHPAHSHFSSFLILHPI